MRVEPALEPESSLLEAMAFRPNEFAGMSIQFCGVSLVCTWNFKSVDSESGKPDGHEAVVEPDSGNMASGDSADQVCAYQANLERAYSSALPVASDRGSIPRQ